MRGLFHCCLIVSLASCWHARGQVDFTTLAGEGSLLPEFVGPSGRHGAAGATVGDNPYVFGGCNVQGQCFDDLYMFRPTTHTWSHVTARGDAPSARAGASMVYLRNYLVLFGGTNNDGTYSDVYRYDLSSGRWSYGVAPGNLRPESRSGHAAATDGQKVFIFGGYNENGKFLDDMWILDLDADSEHLNDDQFAVTFHRVQPTFGGPRGREYASLTYVDGRLYLFGGYGSLGISSSGMWSYDIHGNTWQQLRPSGPEPALREGHAAVRSGHDIIISGGCDVTRNVQKCYNDVWKFNTERTSWSLLSASNDRFGARELHTAHPISGGRILLFGGQKLSARDYGDVLMFKTDSCGSNSSCSGHGSCIQGSCSCSQGWVSHDCGEIGGCPLGCRGHGFCLSGVCHCLPGFKGNTCYSGRVCPGSGFRGDCNGNGSCQSDGTCACNHGFKGAACEIRTETGQKELKAQQSTSAPSTKETKYERPTLYTAIAKDVAALVPGVSLITTGDSGKGALPSSERIIALSTGDVSTIVAAVQPDLPGTNPAIIPLPEVDLKPVPTNLPSIPTPSLPQLPSYRAAIPYGSVIVKILVGALSVLGGGATLAAMYTINQRRKG